MRLLLVRHGTTDALEQGVFQFPETPLNVFGKEQASAVALRLQRETIHAAYVSDFERTRATAAKILRLHPDVPVSYHPELRERNSGTFRGRMAEEFSAAYAVSGLPIHAFRPEGGESWEDAQARILRFYMNVVLPRHEEDTVLFVSHGTVLRCLLLALTGRDFSDPHAFHFENCALSVVHRHPGGQHEVLQDNDTAHLAPVPVQALQEAVAQQ